MVFPITLVFTMLFSVEGSDPKITARQLKLIVHLLKVIYLGEPFLSLSKSIILVPLRRSRSFFTILASTSSPEREPPVAYFLATYSNSVWPKLEFWRSNLSNFIKTRYIHGSWYSSKDQNHDNYSSLTYYLKWVSSTFALDILQLGQDLQPEPVSLPSLHVATVHVVS